MARLLYTVENLVDEVRSKLDEENTDSLDTDRDILPALNRAQDFAFDVLARKYPEPLVRPATLTLVAGRAEYDIPEDIFEDRVQKLEVRIPAGNGKFTYIEMTRVSYRDLSQYESATNTDIPSYYAIYGRTIHLASAPTGTYNARMWSLRTPERLVLPQGRITVLNAASNYLVVDTAGGDLTTEADQLGSYVNVVDGQTGEIKGSGQIQIISSNRITFRTSPLRSTVLGRTIGTLSSITEAELDDYLAPIGGTCVPYYSRPLCNLLIEYACKDLSGKLEESSDAERMMLEKLEQQVERTWVGRESQLRVKKKNRIWGRPTRRWWWR